jgi:hypothetical protein
MFNRSFNLLVMAVLLLSPTLAQARDLDESRELSVGNIYIHHDRDGNVNLKTPNIDINTSPPTADEKTWQESLIVVSRNRSRYRNKYKSTIRRRRVVRSIPTLRINRGSRVLDNRSTMIRNSTIGSESRREEHSIECSNGSVFSSQQSTQVINGRSTVRSEVYTNCQ